VTYILRIIKVIGVASVAKKDLKPGEIMDGEGGYSVFGRLVRADESLSQQYLPLGLSRGGRMIEPVAKDAIVTYHDVALDETLLSFKLRKKLEKRKEDR
jgi:predicted homoserine dehydrogenase-like protein